MQRNVIVKSLIVIQKRQATVARSQQVFASCLRKVWPNRKIFALHAIVIVNVKILQKNTNNQSWGRGNCDNDSAIT